jgi:hypothetical protein
MSPSTAELDLTTKKHVYEDTFKTSEYYCFNPATNELLGWKLIDGKYVPLEPDLNGRLLCTELGLSLGTWKGERLGLHTTWLRWFDAQGQFVPLQSEFELGRAEAERQRAEAERQRADAACARAEAAEQELAALKARLAAQ